MKTALWREYKNFSGCLVRGTDPIDQPQQPTIHLSCAAYLTAQAEAPHWGLVQSFDGAGISAGLLHNILVGPRDLSVGDLGLLVRRLLDAMSDEHYDHAAIAFNAELRAKAWTLSPDGKFRMPDGKLVPGSKLRDWAAPPDGRVPQSGANWEQASKVATLFHDLFTAQRGRKAQEDFAIEWLARGNRAAELEVYRASTRHLDLDSAVALPVISLPPEVHVAMCVYHSFSVNSPAVAAKCLANAMQAHAPSPADFSKLLIRELGLHGRDVWHDQPGDGNNRYDRTRVALWSRVDLFPGGRDLMPRDL